MSTLEAPPHVGSRRPSLIGTTLDGRYLIQRRIGGGGMGTVYEARQNVLHKQVAIKVLDPELACTPNHVKRFLREARAASKIRHMHVVDISDFGQVPDGSVYYVMELLEGRDVSQLLREHGPLPWPRVKNIALQTMHALEVAHDHGVIHRDIKPANILLVPNPDDPATDFVKVVDFGIAKILEPDDETGSLTRPHEIMGTVAYMAPEQALCQEVDGRTDIYSLGVVLYEMLSGQVPFSAPRAFDVVEMHCHRAPPPLATVVPGIPLAIEALVQRALAKQPELRYRDVREFEREVRSIDDAGVRNQAASEVELASTLAAGATAVATAGADHAATDPRARHSTSPMPSAGPPPTPSWPDRPSAPSSRGSRASMVWMLVVWMLVIGTAFALGIWLVASHARHAAVP